MTLNLVPTTTITTAGGHSPLGLPARPASSSADTTNTVGTGAARTAPGKLPKLRGVRAIKLTDELADKPLIEAIDIAIGCWRNEDLWPERSINSAVDRLIALGAAAHRLGILTVQDLLDKSSDLLIDAHRAALKGRPLSGYLKTATAAPLHYDRNVLLAMLMTVAVNRQHQDPALLVKKFVKLQARIDGAVGRPLFDDEIVLCRIHHWAAVHSTDRDRLKTALRYPLLEAGALMNETPPFTRDSLDERDTVTIYEAPGIDEGSTRAHPRPLTLSPFGRYLAAQALARLTELEPNTTQLLYGGKHHNSKAGISAYQTAKTILEHLGISSSPFEVSAKSISLWPAQCAYDDGNKDLHSAMVTTGMSSKRTKDQLDQDRSTPPATTEPGLLF